ncbi:MAG: response regulator [Bacteroidia bacterium]
MRYAFLIICLLCTIIDLNAQEIVWQDDWDELDIGDKVEVFEDSVGGLTIDQVSSGSLSNAFKRWDKPILNFGMTRSIHWIRISIDNPEREDLWLELEQAFLPYADMYILQGDSTWQVKKSGYTVPLYEKPFASHYQLFALPTGQSQLYIRLYSYMHPIPLHIYDHKSYEAKAAKQKIVYGLYSGLLIFVILNNLFLFFSLRKRIYLFYVFLVLTFLANAAFVMEGYGLYVFPNMDLLEGFRLEPTISTTFAFFYCLAFLEVKKYDPKMYRIGVGILIYLVSYIFIRPFLAFEISEPLTQGVALLTILLEAYIGIRTYRRGNRIGLIYATAYFIFFTSVTMDIVYLYAAQPAHILSLSHVSIGGFLEVLFLAYALSKRFEWEQADVEKAKTDAQQQLLAKTQENEKMVREQNEKLQKIDRLKDQFLANTSHELRTPLNGIIGLSESLRERLDQPDDQEDLDLITSAGKRLSSLVNDLLDFSKLQNYDIQLKRAACDLHGQIKVLMRVYRPLIQKKNLELINEVPEDLPYLYADENRLMQILHNLIGNAVKFTLEGSVRIHASIIGEQVRISVTDTGIGIDAAQQSKIFEEFQQGDGSAEREFGGTGLGLSISQQLVKLHGGSIGVESEIGKGATFWFSLPIAPADAKPTTIPKGRIATTFAPVLGATITEVNSKMSELVGDKIRVLIVDDELINQKVLKNHLNSRQYELAFANNGAEALDLVANAAPFDLVLLDVMMPKMSGYEVCERIREQHLPSELPVIMVTAKNQVVDLVQGLQVGANDYLTKPFSKAEFLARVQTQLDLQRIFSVTSKFVPNAFIRALGLERITEVALGDHTQQEVSVLFTDIREYTTLSETMSPEDNFRFVNSFIGRMGPAIQEKGGFVNQYLGDAIMAIFPNEPSEALDAAISMQQSLHQYNQHRLQKDRIPVKMGVGLHSGSLIMGIIGDAQRMDAATISDTVNTASRIESLTKYFGASILLTEDTLNQIDNQDRYSLRKLGAVQVKGRKESVMVYECFDGESVEQLKLKAETLKQFDAGLIAFLKQDFAAAISAFEIVKQVNPMDFAADLFLHKSIKLLQEGIPEDWTGVEKMLSK